MSRREPGRIKRKLAALIEAQGFQCDPSNLYDQKGAWRTDDRLDVGCWEATITRVSDGLPFSVMCWSTMTQCVRYGITVDVRQGDLSVTANMTAEDDRHEREKEAKRNTRRGRWAKTTIERKEVRNVQS